MHKKERLVTDYVKQLFNDDDPGRQINLILIENWNIWHSQNAYGIKIGSRKHFPFFSFVKQWQKS